MKKEFVYIPIILLLIGGIASWLFFYTLPCIYEKIDTLSEKINNKTNNDSFDKKIDSLDNQITAYIQQTNKTLSGQSERINKLEKDLAILITALNAKYPDLNLPALFSMSFQKNISAKEVNVVLQLWQKNPSEAKFYLKNKLQFQENDINAILKFAPTPSQKLPIKNIPMLDKKNTIDSNHKDYN